MAKNLLQLSFLSLLLISSAFSQELTSQYQPKQDEIEQLKSDIARLNTEVYQLKAEIQQLRKQLATSQSASSYSTTQQSASSTYITTPSSSCEIGYWCTKSSGKRHNSSCRYYKNSNGRICGPNDGIACKLCGG